MEVAKMVEKLSVKGSVSMAVAMRVLVNGRIESARRFEGKTFTHIMTPAPDAYSRPQVVEVRSKGSLGGKGEEISINCMLGGYTRKAYEAKDQSTGEVRKIVPVDHTLDLVEEE